MPRRTLFIQISLFLITILTTTLAGAEWRFGSPFLGSHRVMGWPEFLKGFEFSLPFLAILTVHEFGHYFTALRNRVRVTLPYYLPLWLGTLTSIGTMGAFIRIQSRIRSNRQYFDIGIAGPLAGFALALGVLWYGFTHLPPPEYIFTIHPEYLRYGLNYEQYVNRDASGSIALGDNLLFWFFKNYVAPNPDLVPNVYEMIHYPWLLAGYLALFFTALNLIPVGQLDGGHILYGLIGQRGHEVVSPALFVGFVFYSGIGLPTEFVVNFDQDPLWNAAYLAFYAFFLYACFSRITESRLRVLSIALGVLVGQLLVSFLFPNVIGYHGFLPFLFILGRFLGIYHPVAPVERPLGLGRKVLGWLALIVFVLCFSPKPFLVG
ncbi:MAG: site-2 protease family protein [Cytophagaceae bacterium]|nr:site-2 protease family protein [Cytophagaceae bacterium]